jgi:polysaccharide export outer membrane protein
VVTAALGSIAGAEEYRIGIGDVVEISVSAIPDLHQKTAVDLYGNISVPLAGPLHAAELSTSELRTKVRELLSTKVYRRTAPDGHEIEIAIKPAEISLEIAEYKPIYLTGDVAKPGESTYRPGLTVRQAVALAGGYDLMHIRMENPFLESADFKGEYETLRTQFGKQQARMLRIRAELSGPATDNGFSDLPVNSPIGAQIISSEAQQLAIEEADFKNEKAHLQALLRQSEDQLSTLEKQYSEEEEGAKLDSANLQRMEQLYQKGTIPLMRFTDERRTVLLSSTRVLQTLATVAQVKRDHAEIERKLQHSEDQRRLDLVRQLQDAEITFAAVRSKLEAVSEKLLYTGTIKSQLTRGPGGRPEVVIFRKGRTHTDRITASEDTELSPGDVVEIALHLDFDTGQAASRR